MGKLINGKPFSECEPLPERRIVVASNFGMITVFYSTQKNIPGHWEYMEILKPEPKADANGWWRFEDKKPEDGEIVQMAIRASNYGSKHKVSTVIYREYDAYPASFSHWKLWEGPVE